MFAMGAERVEERWPRALSYILGLKGGVDAHSQCTVKASVMLAFRQHLRDPLCVRGMPAPIGQLLTHPPLPSAWIPTVHANVIELMLVDELGEARFLQRAKHINVEYLSSPLYRATVRVLSPAMLIRGATLRWRHFHRGSELKATITGPCDATVDLSYPAGLFAPPVAKEKGLAFQTALELAGASRVLVETKSENATETHYELSWQDADPSAKGSHPTG